MQVIPAVDVLGGRVVRLRQGEFDDVTVYGDDPVAVVAQWSVEGADLVHVVDLEGARSARPDKNLWQSLASSGASFQVGGGIRDAQSARQALEAGAKRVVMGSAAIWHPEIIGDVVASHGAESVVAALDVRAGRAVGSGWQDDGRPIEEAVAAVAAVGVEWILATGVERDGMLGGPDLDLMSRLKVVRPDLQWIVSGGVGSLDDVQRSVDGDFDAIIIGKALYEGRFTLAEALVIADGSS